MSRAHATEAQAEASLLCSVEGCFNRWATDFGKRLCSPCGRAGERAKTKPLPLLREAARPFTEPQEPDEEYVHG